VGVRATEAHARGGQRLEKINIALPLFEIASRQLAPAGLHLHSGSPAYLDPEDLVGSSPRGGSLAASPRTIHGWLPKLADYRPSVVFAHVSL
jgi:hypothetical protein